MILYVKKAQRAKKLFVLFYIYNFLEGDKEMYKYMRPILTIEKIYVQEKEYQMFMF